MRPTRNGDVVFCAHWTLFEGGGGGGGKKVFLSEQARARRSFAAGRVVAPFRVRARV
jgi:hypothetical protein